MATIQLCQALRLMGRPLVATPLFGVLLLMMLSSQAGATTGWDRHQLDVLGKYRIHGANGASFVHRLDAQGQIIEPALCSTLDARGASNGLGSPPDYAVTGSHLVVRYSAVGAASNLPNHFVIRIDNAQVAGPLTAEQLEPALRDAELPWRTPVTAAERFHRAVWLAGLTAVTLAGLAGGLLFWIGRRLVPVRAKGK